jgi:hypothetical protein
MSEPVVSINQTTQPPQNGAGADQSAQKLADEMNAAFAQKLILDNRPDAVVADMARNMSAIVYNYLGTKITGLGLMNYNAANYAFTEAAKFANQNGLNPQQVQQIVPYPGKQGDTNNVILVSGLPDGSQAGAQQLPKPAGKSLAAKVAPALLGAGLGASAFGLGWFLNQDKPEQPKPPAPVVVDPNERGNVGWEAK